MSFKAVTSCEVAETLKGLPVLAVDLGFAKSEQSCGLSNADRSMRFDQAVKTTIAWIKNGEGPEAVLIVEAPLSAAFTEAGNPIERHRFETHNEDAERSDRRWHIGSGGAMALAAAHFLRLIHPHIPATTTINLIEGFASRYGESKPSHVEVARTLVSAWQKEPGRLIELREPNRTYFSTLALIDPRDVGATPIVLRLEDNLSRTELPTAANLTLQR